MSHSPEIKDYLKDSGAIPSLDATGNVLGAPESEVKQKTNAKKAFFLLIGLAALVAMIIGVIGFVKNRAPASAIAQAPKDKQRLQTKNIVMESEVITKAKEELKAKEAQEALNKKAEEEAAAEQALLEEAELRRLNQQNQANHANNANHANYSPSSGNNTGNTGNSSSTPPPPRPLTPKERRLTGTALVDLSTDDSKESDVTNRADNRKTANNQSLFNAMQSASSNGNRNGNNASANGIAGSLQASVLINRHAGKLGNLDYLLKRGTSIPCALETGIDTTLAGFVVCKVTNDVYSANSKTLLIERGASIFGEQQSSLNKGQERTFVLWTRIDNPSGITAELDSPATDQMGYNGIDGYVDTYFWKRFGGAVMMSFIKDFSANLNKNGENTMQNTSQGSADLATETLKNSINIPPTLRVLPATVVYVLVARDINFSAVYVLDKP